MHTFGSRRRGWTTMRFLSSSSACAQVAQTPRALIALAASLALLTGCANTASFKKPQEITWIDAPPDKSILYLLRAPHDSTEVVAAINGTAAARLPSGAYTALVLSPGTYRLATMASSSHAADIELRTGERRFFYISGVLGTSPKANAVASALGGPIVALAMSTRDRTDPESRRWTECTDLDARGLASIATFVTPSSEGK